MATKAQILALITVNWGDITSPRRTPEKDREVAQIIVDSLFFIGEEKFIKMETTDIPTYFETNGLGKTNTPYQGWAICNGNNGTTNDDGSVTIAYGSTYNTMGALSGSANTATLIQDNLPENTKQTHRYLTGSTAGGGSGPEPWAPININFGGSSTPFSIMQKSIVRLKIIRIA